jgi:hypothetical protein
VHCEERNILATGSEGWHVNANHIQPIEQVFPESPGGDRRFRIAVAGGDHSHVDAANRLVAADPLHLAGFEKSEQQRLQPRAHLADLVEEHRSSVRLLEQACSVAIGAGETAPHMPEELALEQGVRHPGAVDGHHPRSGAAASGVQQSRDDLFARAAFARDQDFGVRAGREPNLFVQRSENGTLPDEIDGGHKREPARAVKVVASSDICLLAMRLPIPPNRGA